MFNPSLDHICACHKYYPAAPNLTELDFSSSDFSSIFDLSGDDFNEQNSLGKKVCLWSTLLVGAPLNVIIMIVTISNWKRKSSSSALFVIHLCIGMASKSTQLNPVQFFVHYPPTFAESIKSWLAHLYSSIRQYLRQKWQGFIWWHFDVSLFPPISCNKIKRCIYMETSTQFFISLSVFSLAAIAFDRCVHLVSHTLSRISIRNHYFLFGMVWARAWNFILFLNFYLTWVLVRKFLMKPPPTREILGFRAFLGIRGPQNFRAERQRESWNYTFPWFQAQRAFQYCSYSATDHDGGNARRIRVQNRLL